MPGMSGIELAEQLPQEGGDPPILFVSGYTANEIGACGIVDDGTQVLQKPFSQQDLTRMVRKFLDIPAPILAGAGSLMATACQRSEQ